MPWSRAAVYNVSSGTASWNTAGSWSTGVPPNAVGDNATFNGAATVNNSAQTANRTINLDGTKTVGSILFNTDLSTFTNTVATGTGGPLVFDEAASGPATITTQGAGTGNNTISVAMTLNDSLVANVNNTTASSSAGSLNLTGAIGGSGGVTKNGDGTMTFGTGAKTYTGATVLNGGRTRMSIAAQPSATSSFTINSGAQLEIIAAGPFAVGSGPLNLNGTGASGGPNVSFPGAIRPSTGLAISVSNATVLQSDTLIHVQGSSSGVLTFTNKISGPGKLTVTAPGSDANIGNLVLNGANTYQGGTLVQGGLLQVSGANATFGTGNVTVNNAASPSSTARIEIVSGVLDAINNGATLSLAGGGAAGVPDANYAILGAGINELVAALVLGGVSQTAGTYGSLSSSAMFKSDEFFSGTGIITVAAAVPEASAFLFAGLLASAYAGSRVARRRRRAA
jgi:autotransporter-associated beta strand protein